MRRIAIILVLMLISALAGFLYCRFVWLPGQAIPPIPPIASVVPLLPVSAQVSFSPKGGCTTAIIDVMRSAKKEILIQAYGFSNKYIAAAAVEVKRRGIPVRAVLDKSNRKVNYSAADFLVNSGVPVWIDDSHAIAHNKVMIIDGETVITGSFNFTMAAEERNAENVLILKEKKLAEQYVDNWEKHLDHAEEYFGRKELVVAQDAALQQVADAGDVTMPAELATSEPTPRFFIVTTGGRHGRSARWGYSAERLMEQAAAGGERLIWVGDPEKDTRGDYVKAFTIPQRLLDRGRQPIPPERQLMYIRQEKNGLPEASWLSWGIAESYKVPNQIWRGHPFALRDKQLAETREQMSTLELEAAQQ